MNRQQMRHPERHPLPSVCLGVITAENVHAYCHSSIVGTILKNPGLIAAEIVHISGPRVAEGRNGVIKDFFRADSLQDVEWLLFIDADMTFEPDAIPRLLQSAHPKDRPIVGGLCFAGRVNNPVTPTLWTLDEEGEYVHRTDYPEGLVKVDATGAAFLLLHKSALMRIGETFSTMSNGLPNPFPWFVEGCLSKSGRPMGEDVALCARANACGIPIFVDTTVKIGHMKSGIIDEAAFHAQKEKVRA